MDVDYRKASKEAMHEKINMLEEMAVGEKRKERRESMLKAVRYARALMDAIEDNDLTYKIEEDMQALVLSTISVIVFSPHMIEDIASGIMTKVIMDHIGDSSEEPINGRGYQIARELK